MTYTLTSPIPAVQDISLIGGDPVTEGITSKSCFASWIDGSSVKHLIAFFGGFSYGNWNAHYVNITTSPTGNAMIPAVAPGSAWTVCRDPVSNKLYVMTNYQGSVTEIDPDDPTHPVVLSTSVGHGGEMIIGSDGKLYVIDCITHAHHVFQYDPAVGISSWLDLGAITNAGNEQTGTGSPYGIGATADNIYAFFKKNNGAWTLSISPNTNPPTWTEWEFNASGDTGGGIYIGTDDNWYAVRTLSGGGSLTYLLDNNAPKYHWSESPPAMQSIVNAPKHVVFSDDISDPYTKLADYIGYDSDFSNLFPIKDVHEESKVGWAVHNSGMWNWSTLSFTGPWVSQVIRHATPRSGTTVFCLSQDYNTAFNINYPVASVSRTYLGAEIIAPYCLKVHPTSGEWYAGGYANFVWRYDPDLEWSLTNANSGAISGGGAPGVDGRPNPYRISLPAPLLHYRHGIDFDANGLVWIGGNTTRTNDYGNVMWYNPDDGTSDYLYPGWATSSPKVLFRSICVCLGGTKILVSSNDGYIHRIDASNKSDDNVDLDVSANAWMVETSSDRVMVVMSVADTTQTIGILQPSDMTWITGTQSLGVSGTPFGFTNIGEYLRMYRKLELGPDGFVWMFVGTTIYRIDPMQDPLVLEEIVDVGSYAALKFVNNGTDLFLYNIDGSADDGYHGVKYISRILTYHSVEYSKGVYTTLPADDADLSEIYTSAQREDVALDDEIRVGESGTGYILHEFKDVAGPYDTKVDLHCNLQAPLAPSAYPVYLQCYDRVTLGGMWVTVASDTTSAANTDFDMDFQLNSGTTPTFANCKDESGVISSRVYQTNVPLS